MKISLNWLSDYVDVSAISAEDLAARLTAIGLCCDAVTPTPTDVVLDLDVTSNRPDCLGHIGVAREVAALLGAGLKLPDLSAIPTVSAKAAELTSVEVLDGDLCPRYTARMLRNVKVGPSPAWMVERLEAVGLRSINNVVDATNYVLLEYSQPLHAFDYEKLAGHRIVVRRGREGEVLVAIDGTRCRLTTDMCIIADADKPVAIAGIMGGLESEIGTATSTVLLESARFDPMTTRRTARALGLMSDASYRFERGVDIVSLDQASLRACQLILQTAGGELAAGVVDAYAKPFASPEVTLRPQRVGAILGMDVPEPAQLDILQRLGLSPRMDGGVIRCRIPSWRSDLAREIDLVEEVTRLYGYDKLPTGQSVTHPVIGTSAQDQARSEIRDVLAAAGFDEAICHSFLDESEAQLFGYDRGVQVDPRVRKTNNLLRPTLLPSLLRACKSNQDAGNAGVSLYELAAVFPPGKGQLPQEHTELALVSEGDLPQVRGALEKLVERLTGQARLAVEPAEVAALETGSAGKLTLGGKPIGVLGMTSRAAMDYYGLEKPLAVAAAALEPLLAATNLVRKYQPLPRFPAVRRDLSVVVDQAVRWSQLEQAIRACRQGELQELVYVDTYTGKQLPPGKKSVTLSLAYRSDEGTLRSEQVDQLIAQVVAALGQALSATLRT